MKNKNLILGAGDLIDRLTIANIKISILESKVRNENLSNEERGKLTLQIRKINDAERVPVRNALNVMFGLDYWSEKVTK